MDAKLRGTLDLILENLGEWAFNGVIEMDYSIQEVLGLLIAEYCDFHGIKISDSFIYALDEANLHELREKIETIVDDYFADAVEHSWSVESSTKKDKFYTVSKFYSGAYECTCPAFKFYPGPCKHIKKIQG